MKQNLPNLIIAGAHKAATTSLYTYLAAHPDVYGSGKKEIHYFTPLRAGEETDPIEQYEKYFEGRKNEKYAIDASPSYMYGGEAIRNRMLQVLPPHKVIIILREPVDRFLSNYNWLRAKLYTPAEEDLETFIKKCIEEAKKPITNTNFYGRSIEEGMYMRFVPGWVDAYKNDIKIIYFENVITDPKSVMIDLAKWLNIDAAPFNNMQFTAENKTVFVKNKAMHSFALKMNKKFEIFLRRNHGLKTRIRNVYYMFNKQGKKKDSTDDRSKQMLIDTYKESNKQLAEYLKSKNIKLSDWLK